MRITTLKPSRAGGPSPPITPADRGIAVREVGPKRQAGQRLGEPEYLIAGAEVARHRDAAFSGMKAAAMETTAVFRTIQRILGRKILQSREAREGRGARGAREAREARGGWGAKEAGRGARYSGAKINYYFSPTYIPSPIISSKIADH